jgi:hypothetical protein
VAAARLASLPADFRHVLAVTTHHLAALLPCNASALGVELVGSALLVRGLTALACDLPLLLWIHSGEAATTTSLLGHDSVLLVVAPWRLHSTIEGQSSFYERLHCVCPLVPAQFAFDIDVRSAHSPL